MHESPIRVPLDEETLRELRELAVAERRSTADQAAIVLTRALRRIVLNRGRASARPKADR